MAEYIKQLESTIDEHVASLEKHGLKVHRAAKVAKNINETHEGALTFGQRIADRLAQVAGSWGFIITFGGVLVAWIGLNVYLLHSYKEAAFDPYPFILLNLVLSCLAAIQAPVIMMSQNRAASRDRLQADNDYQVNVKAELEIERLHLKMDDLMLHRWEELLAIQNQQIEILKGLTGSTNAKGA